jgi:hypothetical protein
MLVMAIVSVSIWQALKYRRGRARLNLKAMVYDQQLVETDPLIMTIQP